MRYGIVVHMNRYRPFIAIALAIFVATCGISAALAGRESHRASHARAADNAAAVLFAESWKSLSAYEQGIACNVWESDQAGAVERWTEKGATKAAVATLVELFASHCSLEV